MPVDFSLAPKISGSDYLGPLQAMELGRQAQRNTLKQGREDAQQAAQQTALQQYSSGDTAGAQKTAVASGNFDLADHLHKVDDNHRQQLTQIYGTVLQSAYSLKSLPPEQRQAAFDAQAPRLQAMGVPAATIAEYRGKLDDANLDALGHQSMTVLDQIKQHEEMNKPISVAENTDLVGRNQDGSVRQLYSNAPHDKIIPLNGTNGGYLVQHADGSYEPPAGQANAVGAPGSPSAGGTGGAPRSVRNNNPGNLKASPYTQKLPGYTGTDSGGFAVFDSPQSGTAAQGSLLGTYIDRGINTVAKIINRWAPPSDNNDTSAYVAQVAKALNVNPNDTISKASIPALQAAIARQEGGASASSGVAARSGGGGGIEYHPGGPKQQTPPNGYQWKADGKTLQPIPGGPADGAVFDAPTVSLMADQYLSGDKSVLQNLGRGNQGAKNLVELRKEIYAQATSRGMKGGDVAATMAQFNGIAAQARAVGTISGKVDYGVNELAASIPLAQRASQLLPRGQFVPLNKVEQMVQSGTSSPRLKDFAVKTNAVINAYNLVAGRAGTSVAQREHNAELLRTADSAEAYNAALQAMSTEGAVAKQASGQTMRDVGSTIRGGAKSPPSAAIDHLRQNPGLRAKFDEYYGQGAAARALGK